MRRTRLLFRWLWNLAFTGSASTGGLPQWIMAGHTQPAPSPQLTLKSCLSGSSSLSGQCLVRVSACR